MKKTKLFMLFIMSFFLIVMPISAASTGPTAYSSTDYATCFAAADGFKTITLSEGSYYYTYCYRATCSRNVYNLANMVQNYGYTCQNGNRQPYTRTTSDGCYYYSGTCGTNNSTYCTRIFYIDCNRTTSGTPFTTTTTTRSTETRKTTTSSTTTTTSAAIKLSISSKTMYVGDTYSIKVSQGTATSWTSSNTSIATVNSYGKVTAKKAGTTTITAKDSKGNTAKVTITVKASTTKTTTKTTAKTTKKTSTTTTKKSSDVIITPTTDKSTDKTTTITLPTSAQNAKSTDVKSISINGHKINVTNEKNNYNIKLKEGINNVDVDVELQYPTSQYEVKNNENIPDDIPKEGIDIVIMITGSDTEKREIKINVKRQSEENDDCQLSSIYHSEYLVDYSKNIMDYTIELPKNVKTLNPEVEKGNDEQEVEIKGDENLKNNSKITIEVTAGSGKVCTYTITIKKESNTLKYILIIIILGIILGITGFVLMKYLKKSKGTYKYE